MTLLAPAAWVYQAAVRIRNTLYTRGWARSFSLPQPVISVGNLTLGGSGKTPLVIYIAEILEQLGYVPAVLSRGYGRHQSHHSHVLSPGDPRAAPAAMVGDEPRLIRRAVPGAWVGVSADRCKVGNEIAERESRAVFVLDDGFQHRRLNRDFDIVMIDSTQPFVHNRIVPSGTLREPLEALRRADCIVLNLGRVDPEASFLEAEILRIHPSAELFRCRQQIHKLVSISEWRRNPHSRSEVARVRSAHVVAAIGNPQRFLRSLRSLEITVVGTSFFRDHRRLDPSDWASCVRAAHDQGADALITTEKDAIKLTQELDYPLLVAVQSTEILEEPRFRQAIERYLDGGQS